MSLQCLTKHAAVMLAVAACVFVASGVRAVESNHDQPGAIASTDFSDAVSASCHPVRGACPRHSPRVAGGTKEGPTTPAYEQAGPFDRYSVSSSCHPAYAPSWMACANRGRSVRASDLAQ